MSAAERAVAEVELAIAKAAIIALELSLAAQNGQTVDLAVLIAAYQAAQAVLNSNRAPCLRQIKLLQHKPCLMRLLQ